jgi:3-hydroxybutyryl-CoA dehydrogenase
MSDWKQIGVVGCGLMGAGIAEVCARAGFQVVVREAEQAFLDKGIARVKSSLQAAVEKQKMTADERDQAWGRIRGTLALGQLRDCDLVIEAITEDPDAKKTLWKELDALVKPGAVFASNTSSISITEMAAVTHRADRFVGLHFFNPVPVMKLLEIVRGYKTSEETVAEARAFGERLGKATILAKDTPGFVVNGLLVPFILHALRMIESGICTKEDLDTGMKLGCNHPMGPIMLLDYVGLDTTLFIADVMFDEFKTPMYAAPPLLRRMVAAGHMGRKSGRGFYDWSSGQPR